MCPGRCQNLSLSQHKTNMESKSKSIPSVMSLANTYRSLKLLLRYHLLGDTISSPTSLWLLLQVHPHLCPHYPLPGKLSSWTISTERSSPVTSGWVQPVWTSWRRWKGGQGWDQGLDFPRSFLSSHVWLCLRWRPLFLPRPLTLHEFSSSGNFFCPLDPWWQ